MKQTQVHELMAFSSLILKNEKVLQYLNEDDLKGWAQNRGLFDRKFKIVRIGLFRCIGIAQITLIAQL